MNRFLLAFTVAIVCGCGRPGAKQPYTENDVRSFVKPGTSRDAIIARFGQPVSDDKNPKFEGGYTGVDEILFYVLPLQSWKKTRNDETAFVGFQVRLKDGKAVEWMPSYGK